MYVKKRDERKNRGKFWRLRLWIATVLGAIVAVVTPRGAVLVTNSSIDIVITVQTATNNPNFKATASALKELLAALANLATVLTAYEALRRKRRVDTSRQHDRQPATQSSHPPNIVKVDLNESIDVLKIEAMTEKVDSAADELRSAMANPMTDAKELERRAQQAEAIQNESLDRLFPSASSAERYTILHSYHDIRPML